MKKLTQISMQLLFLFVFSTELHASKSRSDVKILEASEDIKFISQQMVKEYLYLSQNEQTQHQLISSVNKNIVTLLEKIRLIARATKSEDTKSILTYLISSSEEIAKTINQPYSKENAALMLNYSEIVLEGTESITHEHSYDFSKEEQMLINVKNMAYLIERITKYYMAFEVGFTDHTTLKKFNEAVSAFDKELQGLNRYNYDTQSAKSLDEINQYWEVVQKLYQNIEETQVPSILYISSGYLDKLIAKLELYHNRNQ